MQAVPGYSHLYRRGAVYWLRLRVPTDLRSHFEFPEWKETLNTKDLEEAKRALRLRVVEIDRDIAAARAKSQTQPSPPLTAADARRIAQNQLAGWLSDDAEARLEQGPAAMENAEAYLEATYEDARIALASGNWQSEAQRAAWALEEVGRWYPDGDPSLRLMASELLKVRVQFGDMIYMRQRGEVVEAPAVVSVSAAIALAPMAPAVPMTGAAGVTLGDLIKRYRAVREAEHGQESTRRKYGHIFKALEEVLGSDRPIAAITRADCRAVQDLLRAVPSNAGKRYPGLSLKDAAVAGARDGVAVLAPNSISSYLQNLAAVFNWAVDEELLAKNPAKGLAKKGRASVKRRGFATPELQTLFRALAPFRRDAPSRFWVPALALYTGARLNELCQLSASDVGAADGIDYLDFSEFDADTGERVADRSIKTDASDRRVPIHAELIAAGFLEFVDGVRKRGGGRLFPECGLGPDGRHSHGFSKWFGLTMDTIGLTARSLVFHSFRHGFQDACRDAAIREEITDALGGWASPRIEILSTTNCARF